jgi:hypothetical protein
MSPRETSAPTRGEETPRQSSFGSHGGGYHDHPNPLPCPPIRFREVLYSSALDEINFSVLPLRAAFTAIDRASEQRSFRIPDQT